MDSERRRIQDDLRGIIRGDVDCDPVTTMLYASDASIYQIRPLGVVRPRGTSDVAAAVTYAAQNSLAIHPRGAGSGVAGESLGGGLVIDLSRHMRRIQIAPDAATITVEPGATLMEVNRLLRHRNQWYGPDPITRSITTMGSVVARDASGSHYLRSGSARDTVDWMTFVTADGEVIQADRHRVDDDGPASRLVSGIAEIQTQFSQALSKRPGNRPSLGYRIDDCRTTDGRIDLAKFMAGTQGTLGIITEAGLRTEPIPTHRGVVVLFYHRLDMAIRSGIESLSHGVVACDWMDRRLLQIARDTDADFRELLPAAAEAMVLLEIQGESLGDLYDRLSIIRGVLTRGHNGAFEAIDTVRQDERDRYWALSRRVIPRLYRLRADQAPQPFIEDIRLKNDVLLPAIADIQTVLRQSDTTATMFGQLGRSSLHIRPFLNLALPDDRRRLLHLSRDIAEAVWRHGGEISSQHAAGLSKSGLLPLQYGEFWQAMGQVKRLFDPNQRLNPGKLFGSVLQRPNQNLRPSDRQIEIVDGRRTIEEADDQMATLAREGSETVPALPVLQHWPPGKSAAATARACNGCGRCRTTTPEQRQCPVFRAIPTEEATPRAKANLLRAVISGQISVDELSGEKAKAVADLCFNCHQCRLDCPASVDIPKIVGELKAQYVAGNGQTLSNYFLSRVDSVASLASRFPKLSNALMTNGLARWVAEATVGLSAARVLPPIAKETFLKHAARRRWTKPQEHGGLKVCYFVDHFANHHDPDIGRSVAEVFAQNQIGLYVPSRQSHSGMARITLGDIPAARKVARRNVRVLSEAVRAGYEIVASEPAAVLCLKHEYPNLLGTEDSLFVAEHTWEVGQYLWHLHQNDRLSLEFSPVRQSIAYHQPCHLRVLDPDNTTVKLLNLIPDLTVQDVNGGCTGMAGTWGLSRKNYRNSLRIGWPLISSMRASPMTAAATGCGACKMQIEHGSAKRAVHPIKLLAYAYGRMPKVAHEFEPVSDRSRPERSKPPTSRAAASGAGISTPAKSSADPEQAAERG